MAIPFIPAEGLGGFEVDSEMEAGRPLDRQVSGLCSFENLVDALSSQDVMRMSVHRGRHGEVLPRLLPLVSVPGELAEPEVAVGDFGAHPELHWVLLPEDLSLQA
jgi:hypothetical protein